MFPGATSMQTRTRNALPLDHLATKMLECLEGHAPDLGMKQVKSNLLSMTDCTDSDPRPSSLDRDVDCLFHHFCSKHHTRLERRHPCYRKDEESLSKLICLVKSHESSFHIKPDSSHDYTGKGHHSKYKGSKIHRMRQNCFHYALDNQKFVPNYG